MSTAKKNVLISMISLVGVASLCFKANASQPSPVGDNDSTEWKMHIINNDYLIANSMNAADVDRDGSEDYAVIDEFLGLQTIIFFPEAGEDPTKPWERVNLGKTGGPEYSCLGDIDQDGNTDFVVVTGDDLERGYTTGVAIFWGPEPSRVRDSTAWKKAGNIPATLGQQYLYVETHDLDGDGGPDILAGGRRNAITNEYAGLRWIKAPTDKDKRRDLSQWETYFIDSAAYSGHGFVVTDVNEDGHPDILLGNADWDTPTFEEDISWYENPGDKKKAQQPWKKHLVWKSPSFYGKPQIALGDLNKDGRQDLATQTQNYVHVFLRSASDSVAWERIDIRKPENIQWIGRPIKFADVNSDGKIDIVGMLIHNDGKIPADKASVFWMEYTGATPGEDWQVHPIKWSDGTNTYNQWRGEKWDHCIIRDVDGDGDQDIVGNVEENYHYIEGQKLPVSHYSVVWFENPLQ